MAYLLFCSWVGKNDNGTLVMISLVTGDITLSKTEYFSYGEGDAGGTPGISVERFSGGVCGTHPLALLLICLDWNHHQNTANRGGEYIYLDRIEIWNTSTLWASCMHICA
ncbi:unnamed protein product [Absidia cylindrospora]